MKSIFLSLLILLVLTACQDSSSKNKVSLMGAPKDGVNPNSLAYRSANGQLERKNKLEISKIDSKTKIKIAEIQSQNQLHIAKLNVEAKKSIAVTDSSTKIQTSQIDALTKKDDIQNSLYITMAIIIAVVLALFLLYLNNKKNRDLKDKIHKENLEHEQLLKEREYDEKRLHKMLELVENGKLSPDMQEEVISALTKPNQNLITKK